MKSHQVFFLVCMIISVGCSTQVKKEIVSEKEKVSINAHDNILDKTRQVLEETKGLTQKQKDEFLDLHASVYVENQEIKQDMLKLKMVLFKNMLQEDFDQDKIDEVTRQLKKLNDEKIDLMLDAFHEAKKILGVEEIKQIFMHQWVSPAHPGFSY